MKKTTVQQIVLDRLNEELAGKLLPWQKPWQSLFPTNGVSGKPYQGINIFTTNLLGNDSVFLTFKQAKDLGLKMKKGSKGLPIVFWNVTEKEKDNGEIKKIAFLRYFTAFALHCFEDCETVNKLRKAQLENEITPQTDIESFIAAKNLSINFGGNRAFYSPATKKIQLPLRDQFKTAENYYATLFHEIGHKLGDDNGEIEHASFGSEPYAKEELVAEIFASMLCSFFKITRAETWQQSASYLASWKSKISDSPNLLIQAAGKASKRFNAFVGVEG